MLRDNVRHLSQMHRKIVLFGMLAFGMMVVLYGLSSYQPEVRKVWKIWPEQNSVASNIGPITFQGDVLRESKVSDVYRWRFERFQLRSLNGGLNIAYDKRAFLKKVSDWGKRSSAKTFGSLKNSRVSFKSLASSHAYFRLGTDSVKTGNGTMESPYSIRRKIRKSENNNNNIGKKKRRVSGRHKACILVYLGDMRQLPILKRTMESVERNYNWKYKYPWVLVQHGKLELSQAAKDSLLEAASGVVKFVHITTPPTDNQLFMNSQQDGKAHFSKEKYQLHRDEKCDYLKNLHRLRLKYLDGTLPDMKGSDISLCSKLYDPSSISTSRLLSSDIFRLDEVLEYDYFLRVAPGTMFDCQVRYDIFDRFASNPYANVGIAFMEKTLDSRIFSALNFTIDQVKKTQKVKLSKYFQDENSNYNGITLDTESFFVGKTSFFNRKQYISFIRFMDKQRTEQNAPWSASEIISAFFSIVYNEASFVDYHSGKTLISREDILVFEDLGVSDISMMNSNYDVDDFDDIKVEKYVTAKQSCPMSSNEENELLLRNVLDCNCDMDTRYFYRDTKVPMSQLKWDSKEGISIIPIKDTIFREFHDMTFAQMVRSLSETADSNEVKEFVHYFQSFPENEMDNLENIKESKVINDEYERNLQNERSAKIRENRLKEYERMIADKKKQLQEVEKNNEKQLEELKEKLKLTLNEQKTDQNNNTK